MADVITRLKVESNEYDSKIKRAVQGLLQMEEAFRKAGTGMDVLLKDEREFVASLGRMETVSKTARGSLNELTQAYTELAMQYKRLTDEEKKGDFGKALSASLDQLKGRINDTKKQLADVNKELGTASKEGMDFSSVLNALGGQLGINTQLMTAVTGGTMGYVAAIVGVSTAVLAATKALIDYNTEMQRQNNVTSVVTGLSGADAEELTAGIKALSDTYNVDFRAAVEAANTLIHQFGLSGKEALDLLQDGMQGMIMGDGTKLLQMIQQYAPAFRDAGISASQLVAIIHNSEGGLFTDQNMNAIVMGIRNIRLMTKNTSDALKQLGIDGEEMTRKLNDGSMTVFDALRQVSDKIDEVGSGSKAAGEVMQAVFGRQGTMAGTKLGEAIATLNLNLEETRTQTGDLGASFANLQDANRRLDTAMQALLGNTVGWDEMNNTIKSGLLNSLAAVIEDVNTLKTAVDGLDASSDSFKNMADAIDNTIVSKLSTAVFLASQLRKLINGMKGDGKGGESSSGGKGFWSKGTSTPKDGSYWETTDSNGNIIAAGVWKGGKQYQTTGPEVVVTAETNPPKTNTKSGRTSSKKSAPKWSAIEVGEIAGLDIATLGRSYADINKDLTAAKKQYEEAGDIFARSAAAKLIEELGIEKTSMKAMEDPMADANKHNFQQDLNKYNKSQKKDEKKDEKKEVNLLKEIGNMAGGIDQVVGGLDSLGVELPRGLKDVVGSIQSVMTILVGISSVVTSIAAIAAADALIPGTATGGIVPHAAGGFFIPGNYNSGDRVQMALNSGELVLNKAQQGVLAAELTGGSMRNMRLETYVSGRELAIVLNNDTESHGKGRYVVSNRRTT